MFALWSVLALNLVEAVSAPERRALHLLLAGLDAVVIRLV